MIHEHLIKLRDNLLSDLNFIDNGFIGMQIVSDQNETITGTMNDSSEIEFVGISDEYGMYFTLIETGIIGVEPFSTSDCGSIDFATLNSKLNILFVLFETVDFNNAMDSILFTSLQHLEVKTIEYNTYGIVKKLFTNDEMSSILKNISVQGVKLILINGNYKETKPLTNSDCITVCNNCN